MIAARPLLVITPTLGHSPWLDRTVASVAAHAGQHAQHVLVAPAEALDDLRLRYPHCLFVMDIASSGVYPAINLGLINAPDPRWQWFTWLNDDDELAPGFAPHLAQALVHDGRRLDAPWCYGLVQLQNNNDEDLGGLAVARHATDIIPLVQSKINPLNQQGLLIPRAWVNRLGALRESLRICADLDFWLRAVVDRAQFRCTPEVIAVFRLRSGQISGNLNLHRAEFDKVVRELAPQRCSRLRRWFALLRFRLNNASVYAGRLRRSGWKGGYEMLQQPTRKSP